MDINVSNLTKSKNDSDATLAGQSRPVYGEDMIAPLALRRELRKSQQLEYEYLDSGSVDPTSTDAEYSFVCSALSRLIELNRQYTSRSPILAERGAVAR